MDTPDDPITCPACGWHGDSWHAHPAHFLTGVVQYTCPACGQAFTRRDPPRPRIVYVLWQGSAEEVVAVFATEALARDHVAALTGGNAEAALDYHVLPYPITTRPPVAVPVYSRRWAPDWNGIAREDSDVQVDWDYGEGVDERPLTVRQTGAGRWINVEGRDRAAVDAAFAAAMAARAGDESTS